MTTNHPYHPSHIDQKEKKGLWISDCGWENIFFGAIVKKLIAFDLKYLMQQNIMKTWEGILLDCVWSAKK